MIAAPPTSPQSSARSLRGRYVLDTDAVVDVLRKRGGVQERLRLVSPDDVAVIAMSLAELEYGALRSNDQTANRAAYTALLSPLRVLAFGRRAALIHADLRLRLSSAPIGPADLVMAATALASSATIVTANVREFGRVPGLLVESWR